MRPGVNVTTRDNAPPSTIPTDVGTGFMVAVTEAGPSIPTVNDLVQNMDEFKAKYAPTGRTYTAAIMAYDSAETFFGEGGNRLYVGRVRGPASTTATVNLNDNAAAIALVATARGVGEWANALDVVVRSNAEDSNIPVGSFRIRVVQRTGGAILSESYDLVDNTAAIQWAFTNPYISLAAGVSALDPAPGVRPLAGGANDIASITNADWQIAFNSLSYSLGPGILFVPGATTNAIQNMAAEAARRDLRVCFLDGADTASASTLITAAKAVIDGSLARSRFAGLFAPWLIVSGLTTSTVRKVPPSPAVAGVFARNMGEGLSANEPAAGELGRLRSVLAFTQTYTDADRQSMNSNGVNICRDIFGAMKVYGWRTTADPVNDPRWISLNNSILHRQIVAEAGLVGERFIFRQIDGQGHLIGQFGAALSGEVCLPMFFAGSFYGNTPDEAYKVDVGPSVNTIDTISNNELRAVISVRMAPFGEEVNIEVVKYLVTEAIPA